MRTFKKLTLLEMMVAITIFGLLMSSVFSTWFITQRTFAYSTVKAKLEQKARQLLFKISEELIQSGNPTAGLLPDGNEDGFINTVNITSASLDTLLASDSKYQDYEDAIGFVGSDLNLESGILFCKKRADSVFLENPDPLFPDQQIASMTGWSRPYMYVLDKKQTPDTRRGRLWKLSPRYTPGSDNDYTIQKEPVLGSGVEGYMRVDNIQFIVNPLGQITIVLTVVQDFSDIQNHPIRVTLRTTVSPRN